MSLNRVLKIARADLGYTENPPGSNMTKYGEAYGMNGVPWCVEAPWYWFNQAGERMAFFGGGKLSPLSTMEDITSIRAVGIITAPTAQAG